VVDIDGQAHALQTIAKAVQIIAAQVSIDGVATALLNASLDLSGAVRGAVVLSANGALSLKENGFEPGRPLVSKLKPDGELKDLPMDILWSVHETCAPIVQAVRPGITVFCTPVVSRDAVKGLLYLEFEAFRRAKSPSPGNVASFRWNPTTRSATGSPEYYRMLGFDQNSGPIDFVSMTSRVHPADYPTTQAVVDDVVRRRAPYRMEFRIVLPSGDVRNLMWSGHFDLANPDSPELVGVVMDVTELRAADDLLRAAHEDADRQLRLAWLGELAGSIVHEVNQPLASIVSSADAALRWLERDEPDIEAAVKSVERISEIARRAGRTVADMRAMTSNTSLEVVERSMNSIVGEALQMSSAVIARSDVRTAIVFDPAKPMVSVNPAQLVQVMLNLVQNAIDSMREVTDRARILGIRTATDGVSVIVEVSDSGVGLPAGGPARLFDPLYTTKKGGMGLGLAICRRAVLMHGGTIEARSNPDFGALFVISLPRTGSD
jgi:two-component system, LuxR family, sensor kinase FixL